jgi:hypothetical protein
MIEVDLIASVEHLLLAIAAMKPLTGDAECFRVARGNQGETSVTKPFLPIVHRTSPST